MKIENSGIKPISTGKTDNVHAVDNANQQVKLTPGSPSINKDSANVSEKAVMLAKAHSNLANIPDVRMEQVELIKKSIEEGTYTVSPEKLASVLLKYLNFD